MEDEPTAELIRSQLRRLRMKAGLSQEEFGKLVHFSGSQVSAIELGQRPFDRFFLKRTDEVLDTGGLLTSLLRMAERDGQPSWLQSWLDSERQAQQLRCYQPSLIHGLLQTENYARSVIRTDDMISEDEVERRVADRMERQSLLFSPDPPKYVAVIEEVVLRRADENFRGLMAEQIAHLIECAQRPHIHVHIVPVTVALHVGLVGPFSLARGRDGGWVGHLETQLGGEVVDKDEDMAILLARWESVRSEALSRQQSIELMKEVITSWS
ncbi:helix-turn-helix domain-containing protein [Micromonospora narathiwatensis]|uniref:Helix-turn-helix domain-containing protein n=1 Tax=Micromonospora narathiwatensis TaxID=299146 RepID=A0A1A9AA92_9ACTN|nr:helix-turn-helix transcriptional regulator [Micromonospora narathiwatensis]SBT53397.1 Helix-turn-helix domain-containing protein [Micromonospora narathiwatensis]